MYQSLLEFLKKYSAADLIVLCVALITAVMWIYPKIVTIIKNMKDYFKDYFDKQNKRKAEIDELHKNTEDIKILRVELQQSDKKILEASEKKDREILEAIEKMKESIDALNTNFETYKERQRERKEQEDIEKREDLRDELISKYLLYKSRGSITDMELETFLKKEERYEALHGNSYVHDTIKPFVLSLKVINEIGKSGFIE